MLNAIQNLSVAELKTQRAELIKEAKAADAGELATRYVQALTDAKLRDETLAQQAKTLHALQQGIGALQEQKAALERAVANQDRKLVEAARAGDEMFRQIEKMRADHAKALGDLAQKHAKEIEFQLKRLADLEAIVARETARGDRLKGEARRNHAALTGAAKLLNDAIAAQAIDNADEN